MSKEKTLATKPAPPSATPGLAGSLAAEFMHAGLYKPSQGKGVRQVTFGALALVVAIGCWELMGWLGSNAPSLQYPVPLVLLLLGWWVSYRLVNLPRFADFLIAVQAEMNKVSWPTQQELIRSSLVVIFVIFLLAVILFGFDILWVTLFRFIGVLRA